MIFKNLDPKATQEDKNKLFKAIRALETKKKKLSITTKNRKLTNQEFSDALRTEENEKIGGEFEDKVKVIEETLGKIDYLVPFFISYEYQQPPGEFIKPGDVALFTGTLHTVDDLGYLVEDETGLLAGTDGSHYSRNDSGKRVYCFNKNLHNETKP